MNFLRLPSSWFMYKVIELNHSNSSVVLMSVFFRVLNHLLNRFDFHLNTQALGLPFYREFAILSTKNRYEIQKTDIKVCMSNIYPRIQLF